MSEQLIGLAGLFASAFVSATIAPGGSEALLAYMVADCRYPLASLLVAATLGNTLGAITTWLLGVAAAKKYPVATLLSQNQQNALAFVKKRGAWALFFSWLPVIGDALCFAAGWLRLPWLPTLAAIALGKLGRYAAIAWLFV